MINPTMTKLLSTRRFAPMFFAMLTTVMNDSILRSAFILYLTFGNNISSEASSTWADFIVAAMVLPFFFLSATAGELADKYRKSTVIQIVKIVEIPIICLTSYVLIADIQNPLIFVGLAFIMGAHSALFAPAKYAYLPEYLTKSELLTGNSLIEGFTFIGLLIGGSLGSLVLVKPFGPWITAVMMIVLAVAGYISSMIIPTKPPADPKLKIKLNIFSSTQKLIDQFSHQDKFWLPILGISWFWFISTIIQTQFANYVLNSIYGTDGIVTTFNLVFTLGIGLGSLMCGKIMHNKTDARYAPITLLIMSIAGLHLYFITAPMGTATSLITLNMFLATWQGAAMIFDIFVMCFAAGIFIIPLYTLLQKMSKKNCRSRVIGCNNVINSIWMVSGNLVSLLFIRSLGVKIETLIAFVMITNLAIVVHLTRMIPFSIIKPIAKQLLSFFFRVEVKGAHNLDKLPHKAIIISNHVSYLDVPVMACFLPGEFVFAVNPVIAEWWVMRMVKHLAQHFSVDTSNPLKTKSIIKKINDGNRCIIFPEGRLTDTGNIMRIYNGTAMVAEHTDAPIIPLHLDGVEFSITSRAHKLFKSRLFPKITLTIGKPFKPTIQKDIPSKLRRELITQQIYDAMTQTSLLGAEERPIYDMLLDARKLYGRSHIILDDLNFTPLTYQSLITKTEVLGQCLEKHITRSHKYIGVMLPNVTTVAVTVFSLYRANKVPAMINYTADGQTMLTALKTMEVKTLITSRAFIEKASLTEEMLLMSDYLTDIIYLEDLKEKISISDKVFGAFNAIRPSPSRAKMSDPAVVLYTSGSEGTPKAVILSHKNIITNINQSLSILDFSCRDRLMNILPMFHAFGFTLGTLTPILKGIRCFLYPNPRHHNIVSELIYEQQITVMIGTNTFLKTYQQSGTTMSFSSLRYVFAGGEKLANQTRHDWLDKFGKMILQGYGTTECAPVLCVNTLQYNKTGSVGRLLPGIEHKLTPFENGENSNTGVLHVRGDNIMMGYVYADNPTKIVPPKDKWYDTGDVVSMDEFGFVTIVDRIKRFAKIAGEMVSLTAVEQVLEACLPDIKVAAVNLKDERKGEKIVLVTEEKCNLKDVKKYFTEHRISPLMIPSQAIELTEMPELSTGKNDYPAIKRAVIALLEEQEGSSQ